MPEEKPGKTDLEAEGRKAAAQSLKHQIDDLVAGKTRPAQAASLRDFIDRKMAEDKQEKGKETTE